MTRYHFELVPTRVDGVPPGVDAVAVLWERGAHMCVTEPAAVDPRTRSAAFHEVMRMVRGRGVG